MTEITLSYEGDLSTRCIHSDNQTEILTDAPKDNQGQGRYFSPTDLFAASLGSCILTMMGFAARKMQLDIRGVRAVVTKEMAAAPSRRVGKLKVEIYCPLKVTDDQIAKLKQMAEHCPVKLSLHPDTLVEVNYHWGMS
jgi:putative redox protein